MTLATHSDGARWSVVYYCMEGYERRVNFRFELDAVSGEVLVQSQA